MRTTFYSLLLLLSRGFIYGVHSAPLQLKITNDAYKGKDNADAQRLRGAQVEANKQIDQMHYVLHIADAQTRHKHLVDAFGANYNEQAIKDNVKLLRTQTLNVHDVHVKLEPGVGKPKWSGRTPLHGQNVVKFSNHFHDGDDPDKDTRRRAGVVIHEATHALFKSKDFFHNAKHPKDIKPIDKKQTTPDSYLGYLHKDFGKLREKEVRHLHLNADSYRKFGHSVTYGDTKRLHGDLSGETSRPGSPRRPGNAQAGPSRQPDAGPSQGKRKRTSNSPPTSRSASPANSPAGRSASPTKPSSALDAHKARMDRSKQAYKALSFKKKEKDPSH